MSAPMITVRVVKRLGEELGTADLEIGPVQIGSVYIPFVDGKPRVSWPRTQRGFPIVSVSDPDIRAAVEAEIIRRLPEWRA